MNKKQLLLSILILSLLTTSAFTEGVFKNGPEEMYTTVVKEVIDYKTLLLVNGNKLILIGLDNFPFETYRENRGIPEFKFLKARTRKRELGFKQDIEWVRSYMAYYHNIANMY